MAKTKVISAKEAGSLVKDGMTVMIGGFTKSQLKI